MKSATKEVKLAFRKNKLVIAAYALASVMRWRRLACFLARYIGYFKVVDPPKMRSKRWHPMRFDVGKDFELTAPLGVKQKAPRPEHKV